MQVLVRHDDTIQGGEHLIRIVTAAVEGGLHRFVDRITTVEVHLADENGHKTGGDDIRATVEVHLAGRPPLVVKHHAEQLVIALEAAVDKMARMLDSQLDKLRNHAVANG